jgi:hypothetical protein
MDTLDPLEPVKIKVRPNAVEVALNDLFPGSRLKKWDRIGGVCYEVQVWRYKVNVSVTLEAMNEIEKSGDAVFMLMEYPSDDMKQQPRVVRSLATGDMPELRAELERVRQSLMGVVQAITMACTYLKTPETPVSLLDGEEEP